MLIAGKVPAGEGDMAYFAANHDVQPVFIEEMSRELSFGDLIALYKIWRRLIIEKADIVHTHTAKAGTLGRAAAFLYRWLTPGTLIGRPRRVSVFHTFHGHIFHGYYGPLKTRVFLVIERILAKMATDRIVVISGQQLTEINETFGVGKPAQFAVIPLGLDLKQLEFDVDAGTRFRDAIGVKQDEFLVGIVGRLTEIKNHRLFVEAATRLAKDSNFSHVSFVIVGDGHLRKELEDRSADSGIIFAGNCEDTAEFYSALDLVALTSLNEGTPLTLIEAMAFGKSWISSCVGGVVDLAGSPSSKSGSKSESISNDETSSGIDLGTYEIRERGVVFGSGDVEGLVAGIKKLVEDKSLRATFTANGQKFVTEKYSKERLVTDIKKLYGMS